MRQQPEWLSVDWLVEAYENWESQMVSVNPGKVLEMYG